MSETTFDRPKLYSLIGIFYDNFELLGRFEPIGVSDCPLPYRELLAHSSHMTVAVENHHGELVDVDVLEQSRQTDEYRRKILLRRQSDRTVVQFGIVRINFKTLAPEIQQQITSGKIPLGRILIENDLMREVQLSGLWRVECGRDLSNHFQVPIDCVTYGRTARILVDSIPVIELLEIVAPETESQSAIENRQPR